MARKKSDKRKKPRRTGKVNLQQTSPSGNRSRPAPSKVSLLAQYPALSAVRKTAKESRKAHKAPAVIPVTVPDPWPAHAPAILKASPPQAEDVNPDEVEWIVPDKPPVEVFASRRNVIAGMKARGQIDDAMFLAARDYAAAYETAMSVSVRAVDTSSPVVSGRNGADVQVLEAVAEATRRLKVIETALRKPRDRAGEDVVQGDVPIALMREVLGDGSTIEKAAKRRGDGDRQGVGHWGWLTRKTLEKLAEVTGYAVKNAYRNREREDDRLEEQRRRNERRDRGRKRRGKARQRKVENADA